MKLERTSFSSQRTDLYMRHSYRTFIKAQRFNIKQEKTSFPSQRADLYNVQKPAYRLI